MWTVRFAIVLVSGLAGCKRDPAANEPAPGPASAVDQPAGDTRGLGTNATDFPVTAVDGGMPADAMPPGAP